MLCVCLYLCASAIFICNFFGCYEHVLLLFFYHDIVILLWWAIVIIIGLLEKFFG